MSAETKFARVGRRFHVVLHGGPMYDGQPEVAMCGTVFIRAVDNPDHLPLCVDCSVLDVDRLRHEADRLLDQAAEKALAINEAMRA